MYTEYTLLFLFLVTLVFLGLLVRQFRLVNKMLKEKEALIDQQNLDLDLAKEKLQSAFGLKQLFEVKYKEACAEIETIKARFGYFKELVEESDDFIFEVDYK